MYVYEIEQSMSDRVELLKELISDYDFWLEGKGTINCFRKGDFGNLNDAFAEFEEAVKKLNKFYSMEKK